MPEEFQVKTSRLDVCDKIFSSEDITVFKENIISWRNLNLETELDNSIYLYQKDHLSLISDGKAAQE